MRCRTVPQRLVYHVLAATVYYLASGWSGMRGFCTAFVISDVALQLLGIENFLILTVADAAIRAIIAGALLPRSPAHRP